MTRLYALNHVCNFHKSNWGEFGTEFINESIFDVIKDMAPSINGTFNKCSWNYKLNSCSEYFKPVFTGDGLCYTFNSLNSYEIYTEE